jgi:chromosome segregation ATPase
MNPRTFGLSADVPEAALDPEWRALVRQQARTLAGTLQRFQTAVAGVPHRPDASRHATARVQALAADAERLLTAQAQQQVSLERELAQLRALVTALSARPAAMTERVRRLEQVLEVVHANLTTARQYLATLLSQEP